LVLKGYATGPATTVDYIIKTDTNTGGTFTLPTGTGTIALTSSTVNNSNCLGSAPQVCYVMMCGNQNVCGVKNFVSCIVASGGVCGNATTSTTTTAACCVLRTVTGTTCAELVRGNMADNDQFRILIGGTASNAGFVEIATADDGTEPIHVRQYTGVFATLTRTATLLDGTGCSSFPVAVVSPRICATTSICGPMVCVSGTVTSAAVCVVGNANPFRVIGTDHVYQEFYPRGVASGRRAYFGYAAANSCNFNLVNESSTGCVIIGTEGTGRLTVTQTGGVNITCSLGVGVNPNATPGRIDASNDIVAFSSDRRLKDNIQTIQCPLYKLQNLSGFLYNWNKTANQLAGYETGSKYVGLYAQEVQSVLPEAVKLAPFDNDGQDTSISGCNYLTVQYEKLVPLLVEAIKEQQCQIEELKCSLSILNGGR
jgi:hypothetical protein